MDEIDPETVRRLLLDSGLAAAGNLQGCSEQDIATLERRFSLELPAAYRAFLRAAGRGAGRLLTGTDFLYPQLPGLREVGENLVREAGAGGVLGPQHFVFLSHQGYQVLFFDCDLGADPPVQRFMEGDERAAAISPSFSAWLRRCIEDESAAAAAVDSASR